MSTPILTTKLYIPPPRPQLVPRPRLLTKLNERMSENKGFAHKLTLISASAGFGKTTLVSEWLVDCRQPIAWLSLDADDSDPARFLRYFIAALQTIAPNFGAGALSALQSPQLPPLETLLIGLINEITTIPDHFIFVLDDYHLLDAPAIDKLLTFFLDHQPPQMHLVIATREDPSLPLPRLRVRGQMRELRAAELRFTVDETAVFLNQVMGLTLSPADITALENRTEGWIAGLQLAALSLPGNKDAASFIQSFSGKHHFVLDYLIEEVLQQQPEEIQTFLLQTSILNRLCGSLCDAVLDNHALSGQKTLESIEQANLFIIPLDNERRWYRYHHLFADLLRQRLGQTAVNSETLHQRASLWFEANDLQLEAFQHAAAANDVKRAAKLLEKDGQLLYFQGVVAPILNWLESLPDATLDKHASLWIIYASALTITGQPIPEVNKRLQSAEAALQRSQPFDDQNDLIGRVAALRAMLAIPTNDLDSMLAQAQTALAHLDPHNMTFCAAVNMTLGYAYLLQGDLAAAQQAYQETVDYGQAAKNITFTLAGYIGLGNIQEAQGQLYLAKATYQQVIEMAGDSPLPYVCAAYLGLTQISYEWGDWEAVWHYGQQGIHFGQQLPSIDVPAACKLFFARIKLAQNDLAGAATLLDEAEQSLRQREANLVEDITAVRTQLLIRQGKLAAALQLAQDANVPSTIARVYLAQGETNAALNAIETARQQADDKPIELLLLEAMARQAKGENETAQVLLQQALLLGEPGGFVRTFVDEGAPVARLLAEAKAQGVAQSYIAKLLSAFDPALASQPHTIHQSSIDALSQRELEVLRLIAKGHTNREISQQLFLALDTIKGHNRKIFAKLQVQRRTEAVARAREQGLL